MFGSLCLACCLPSVGFGKDKNKSKLVPASETLKAMRLTNQYFMDKWPDTGKDIFVPSRNKTWPSHIWTRGVYYED